jgi:hypothetical protein
MHHALISCAIKLPLYETGGEAALYGVQEEGTRRTAKKITYPLQTRWLNVNKRSTGDASTARRERAPANLRIARAIHCPE